MGDTERFDLVVVGGGVIGSSVAYHCAARGQRVLLLEQGEPLTGTTGATFAWLGAHLKKPASYNRLSQQAIACYEGLETALQADVEYARLGSVLLVRGEDELERWRGELAAYREQGFRLELWEGARLRQHEPVVPPSFAGALHCPVDVEVNPFRLVQGYLSAARRLGAQVRFGVRVTGFERAAGAVTGVVTSAGRFAARQVVCAVGIDADRMGALLGVEVPILRVKGQVLVTERWPRTLNGFLAYTMPVEQGGFMVKQVRAGNFVLGYTQEQDVDDRDSTWDGVTTVARNVARGLPALGSVNVIRAFAGVRVVPKDSLPIISEVEGWAGVVMLAMHSGLTLSVLVGRTVAEHFGGEDRSAVFREYGLARFAQAQAVSVTAFGGTA
jgi:glycine/D-amino acid oxidase-like deaminating enzyme